MKMNRWVMGMGVLLMPALFAACAGTLPQDNIIALVDETRITESDIVTALTASHMQRDKSARPESFDIRKYLDKIIDDRLLLDEARRMGLETDPAVQKRVRDYTVTLAVMRLYEEEVRAKSAAGEEDLKNAFERDYVSLGLIEVATEQEAEQVRQELMQGADFAELAEKRSTHISKTRKGAVVYKRTALTPLLTELAAGLSGQEVSKPAEISGKWYLFMLQADEEAVKKNFETVLPNIRKDLNPKLKSERQEELLARFRQKFPVSIDQQLLDSLDFEAMAARPDDWSSDSRALARVGDLEVTVADFAKAADAKDQFTGRKIVRSREEIFTGLINTRLIDAEALSRGYDRTPEMAEQIRQFREAELRRHFFNAVIFPYLDLSEERQQEFYRMNPELFRTEPQYRFQQIRLKTEADARRTEASLKEGADFLWVAKSRLAPNETEADIATKWQKKSELPEQLRQTVDSLRPGDISPAIRVNDLFVIYRLIEKKDSEPRPYTAVKDTVRKSLFEQQHDALMDEAMSQLRGEAEITVNEGALREIEQRFRK